jgi:histidinol dehydrogenase
MRTIIWHSLNAAEQRDLLRRPAQRDSARVAAEARRIVDQVRRQGDAALFALTERFDGARLTQLRVTAAEFDAADRALSAIQHAAIERALQSIHLFHAAQMPADVRVNTARGVLCERFTVPIHAVGLYVPAGSAPLPSTALMLAVPAAIAGCPVRVMCTPPTPEGEANAAVLVAARKAGIDQVFKAGGAQAIAAMAYGTNSLPKCDKVFGPGNAWDDSARADFVAADLLAQAEHSPQAQAILVTTEAALAGSVSHEVSRQRQHLSRTAILDSSIAAMRFIVVDSLDTALQIANSYAPEHLLLEVHEPRAWLPRVSAAGAVFLGSWSPESLGDYCAGPNHTLPTYGYARSYSGLSLEDFQKRISVQEISPEGLREMGPVAQVLAEMEGLDAHAAAVAIRLAAMP